MTKYLTLIRHAKSSWSDNNLSDHARKLNQRGQDDAQHMGKVLQEREIKFALLLCSNAQRAKETLALLREQLKIRNDAINYLDELYCAPVPTLIERIHAVDNGKNNIAIVGHNPGLEDLAAMLTDGDETFSTCSVMQIGFEIDDWRDVDKTKGKQILFLSPKTV